MGISSVRLETEKGKVLEQVSGTYLLDDILPAFTDESFPMLRFVDPYGDTIFNKLQMTLLLTEWQRLYQESPDEQHTDLLKRVERLIESCKKGIGLYVRFFGD